MVTKMDPEKPRVLVIEDDPDMQKLYQMTLDTAGFEVEGAYSGAESFKRLHGKEYAAVLSDLRLPDAEGADIIKQINDEGLDPVTFLMSAHADTKTAVGWFALGIEDYFLKPFSTDELEIKLKRALSRREMESENRRLKEELARLGGKLPPRTEPAPAPRPEPEPEPRPGPEKPVRPAPPPQPAPPIMRPLLGAVGRAIRASVEEVAAQAARLIKMVSSTDPVTAPASRVLMAAESCAGVLDRVLRFADAEPLRFEPCDIRRLLGNALLSVGDELENAGIEVSKELEESLPKVRLDEARVGEAVLALVENAAQAMPEGGTLKITAEKAGGVKGFKTLNAGSGAKEEVRLEFADSGTGIREEELAKVCEPFFTTRPGSRGLGLTLAREAVLRHGGSLEIKSKGAGKGTTVILTLPVNGPAV